MVESSSLTASGIDFKSGLRLTSSMKHNNVTLVFSRPSPVEETPSDNGGGTIAFQWPRATRNGTEVMVVYESLKNLRGIPTRRRNRLIES